MHFAIAGQTAAEIIADRVNASKANMGLTSWKGEKLRKSDVTIAKNYLNKEELEALNRIVSMYLDFAEDQAKRHRKIFMRTWRNKLDSFLQFNERNILEHAGVISHEVAKELAEKEYEIFNRKRIQCHDKRENDFDKSFKRIETDRKRAEIKKDN